MRHELEAKFINLTLEDARKRLRAAGFACVKAEFLMRRKTFHFNSTENKWGRVRDEGDKVTMTIKHITSTQTMTGTREVEVVVDSFDNAAALLVACGLTPTSYQENRREIWVKGGAEAAIDTWPGLEPYIELEADTAEAVKQAATELGFDFKNALFDSADVVYEKVLGIPSAEFIKLPEVTFDSPPQIPAKPHSA